MKFIQQLFRRIEWLIVLSYFVIVIVEIIVLRNLSGSPEANFIRYATFFSIILLSFILVRQQVVKPIQEMQAMSRSIAEGNYHQRLPAYQNIELNQLATAFNQMVETIETSEKRRVELIGDMAHELRTPLNNIKITLEGIIDEMISAGPETYFNMQHEISRLQRLISQLETLSRAESDQTLLTQQPVQLDALILETVGRLMVQFEDKGVRLETAIADEFPVASFDSDAITQILINLVGNAMQYTPAGGRVNVSADFDRNSLTLKVTDSGIGISAEELDRIFERFYRTDKSRARASGGNGVGLTIAKHLVQAHNGRIEATSPGKNQGSTITVTFPRHSN